MNPGIFRAYDIRGVYGQDFVPRDFFAIAQAYGRLFKPKTVVLGHDARETSPELWQQAAEGLTEMGIDVLNIGGISTEMLYFAVVNYRADGGLIISASHNPREYNGMKLVREHAIPISGDSGIMEIRDEALKARKPARAKRGVVRSAALMEDYLQHLRYFVDMRKIKPKKVVLNANCGYAGLVVSRLLAGTPVQFEKIFFEPDGTFSKIPNGRPDPLRPENRVITTETVRRCGADFATAWDADADRCFFFDERGDFVEGAYISAVLSELLLKRYGGGSIVFDPRVIWPVEHAVLRAGGKPVINKCGHSFFKERMRKEDALFGGESSAHYYFRRNFYADNGMVPFLLLLEHLSETGISLSERVREFRSGFPNSGEINFKFKDMKQVPAAVKAVKDFAKSLGNAVTEPAIDGLSIRFLKDKKMLQWRFNLRESNTEAVLRLNVETIADESLLRKQTEALAELLVKSGGQRDTPFRW